MTRTQFLDFCLFFFLPLSESVMEDCWLAALHALDRLLMLDMLSLDMWRLIRGGSGPETQKQTRKTW